MFLRGLPPKGVPYGSGEKYFAVETCPMQADLSASGGKDSLPQFCFTPLRITKRGGFADRFFFRDAVGLGDFKTGLNCFFVGADNGYCKILDCQLILFKVVMVTIDYSIMIIC
jgi:hypothetical protein